MLILHTLGKPYALYSSEEWIGLGLAFVVQNLGLDSSEEWIGLGLAFVVQNLGLDRCQMLSAKAPLSRNRACGAPYAELLRGRRVGS